jgi:flagellar motor protein MotB
MARKHKHPEHVNHERWLVSYADFITLLFAFFVVLYAMSEVDKNKMKKFSQSVQFAFAHVGSGGTNTMGSNPVLKRPNVIGDKWPQGKKDSDPGPYEALRGVVQFLENSLVSHFKREENIKTELVDDGRAVLVKMPVERLFAPRSATLRPDRLRFLEDLGWCLQRYNLYMEVNVEIDLPFGEHELVEHQLGSRRADALVSGIWKASVVHRVKLLSRVILRERDEVKGSEAEGVRSVVEFRVTR